MEEGLFEADEGGARVGAALRPERNWSVREEAAHVTFVVCLVLQADRQPQYSASLGQPALNTVWVMDIKCLHEFDKQFSMTEDLE